MAEEVTLFEENPAMFRNRPVGFLLLLALTIGGVVLGAIVHPALFLLTGLGVVAFVVWWLKCKGTKLIVTNEGTTLERGLLSKSTNELWHSDVRNVQIDQTFFQRMFDVGTVGISSGGQAGIEIIAAGIPHPQKVHEIIEEQRRRIGQA